MAGVEVRAVARNLRMSSQKVRRVLDTVRGKPVGDALAILRFLFIFLFARVRCPWCRTWWPTWKTPDWGPRNADNAHWCANCGRKV